jgi:predicted MFS family arabinose efflux permease
MLGSKSVAATGWNISLALICTGAAIALAVSMGLRQSLGLLLSPMTRDAGVTAAGFGLAMAVQNLAWGFSQPFIGYFADRWGSRAVLLCAGPVYAAGLLLMAYGDAAGLLLGGGALVGLAVSGSAFGVVLGAVSRAASDGVRAVAVSIVSAAGSLGTLILAPLAQHLISTQGWQNALVLFAAISISISLTAVLLSKRTAQAVLPGPAPQAALTDALAHRGFLAMTAAFFACGFQLVFISTHLPGYLELCGLRPSVGAAALALIGVFNAVGTMVIGIMGARYGNSLMLALVYLLRTLAIALYVATPVSVETTLIFASVMGLLWLSVAPLVSALITNLFGVRNFGTIFGVMFLSHQIGSFFGAWLGGLLFDRTGAYQAAWLALIGVGFVAFLLQITANLTPKPVPA